MKILKLILINLIVFLLLDQVLGFFLPEPIEYLNKSKYPWESYSSNYRNYFDKDQLDGKTFYTIKRKWNERLFHSKPIPNGKRKILAIGDSFTWGQGVRFKDTYIKKIEKLNKNVVGINIAKSGADLNQIKTLFFRDVDKIKPEQVFYGYCLNDMFIDWNSSNIVNMDWDKENKYKKDIGLKWDFINKRTVAIDDGRNSKLYNYLQWSPIFKKIYRKIELENISKNTIQHYKDIYDFKKNKIGIEKTIRYIKMLKDKSSEFNAKFTIIIFPIIYWTKENYEFKESQDNFIKLLTKNNIDVIDMTSTWRNYAQEELWVHPVDQHPNDFAHELVAREINKLSLKPE
jgi:hypothetical protein